MGQEGVDLPSLIPLWSDTFPVFDLGASLESLRSKGSGSQDTAAFIPAAGCGKKAGPLRTS